MSVHESYAGLHRIMTRPKRHEIKHLGNLIFFDTYYEPLIKKHHYIRYMISPKLFVRDFMLSNWKIGYLKKVFVLPIADKIYLLLLKLK